MVPHWFLRSILTSQGGTNQRTFQELRLGVSSRKPDRKADEERSSYPGIPLFHPARRRVSLSAPTIPIKSSSSVSIMKLRPYRDQARASDPIVAERVHCAIRRSHVRPGQSAAVLATFELLAQSRRSPSPTAAPEL